MKKLVLFVLFLPLSLLAQKYLPTNNGEVVKHTVLTISYIEEHEQAEWVYYELTPEMVNGLHKRKDDFRPDTKVSTETADEHDYDEPIYDQGHLAPADDMKLTETIMSESFFYSNMSPQTASFNRGGVWRKLERTVHFWGNSNIVVVTGPIFKDNLGHIGKNKVTVPGYYYKVIYSPSTKKMIGFILPHIKVEGNSLIDCITSVDNIEEQTGIDFFPQLDDQLENDIEASKSSEGWNFKIPRKARIPSSKPPTTHADQCKATVKSTGTQCKRKASNSSKFCWQHK